MRVRKRRYRCLAVGCPRRSFTESTDEVPVRARLTTRLAAALVAALCDEPRSVTGVARAHGLSWPTVMRLLVTTVTVPDCPPRVWRLGIDEHRFTAVRYMRVAGKVVARAPWSVVFIDLDTGAILDIVPGQRGSVVRQWLADQPLWWRTGIEQVALDMSGEFRAAVRDALPDAQIVADHWHVMTAANRMVTACRRRRSWERHSRRGRKVDPPWRYRQLLLARPTRFTARQRSALDRVLAADAELARAWAVKELVRQLLSTRSILAFDTAWAAFTEAATAADAPPEALGLLRTLSSWRGEIQAFCLTGTTNARTEAANLNAKTIKRNARGFRNHHYYRCRIMAYTTNKVPVTPSTPAKVE